jgi:CIC family chloride channel protein
VDISGGLEQNVLKSLKVHEFMRTDPVIVPESMHLIDMIHTFKHDNVSYLHMVNETGDLTGIISFRDIRILLDEEGLKYLVIAKDVATTDVYTISPDDDILKALKLMSERGIAQLPVVDGGGDRKVVGVLTEKDLFAAYDQAVIRRELESA